MDPSGTAIARGHSMRIPGPALLLLLALPAAAEHDDRFFERNVFLDGETCYRPAVGYQHEMTAPGREVVLHLVWRRGLYRLSQTGKARGTTAGVFIEANDATRPTHPRDNPFCPIPVQRGWNPDWTDCVDDAAWPWPNEEPGYWYTWDRRKECLERPIVLRFAEAGRYRIRIAGVVDEQRTDIRVPTLMGITEVDAGFAPEAAPPEAFAREPEPERKRRVELAYPTGRRATSLLLLERETPLRMREGERFTYVIRVKNLTRDPIEGVAVVEDGDALKDARGDPPPRVGERGELFWDLGDLAPREEREIRVEASAAGAGPLVRSVRVLLESPPLSQAADVR